MIKYVGTEGFWGGDTATIQEAIDYCMALDVVAYDSEFTHLIAQRGDLLCQQIGDDKVQYVVDNRYHSPQKLRELLQTKVLLGQGLHADLPYLFKHNIVPIALQDTFVAETVLTTGYDDQYRAMNNMKRDLGSLVYKYLGVHLNKSEQSDIAKKGLIESTVRYSGLDIAYLHDVYRKQMEYIDRRDLGRVLRLELKYLIPFSLLIWSGAKLDVEKLRVKIQEDKLNEADALEALAKHLEELSNTTPRLRKYIDKQLSLFDEFRPKSTINFASPKQVVALFNDLGIKTKHFINGKERDTVNADVIAKQDHSIIPLYIDYKEKQKISSSYGSNMLEMVGRDGRIYTKYKQIISTGRISSGGGAGKGVKTLNFQNIPGDARHRSLFVPERGCVFVQADYTQQESVILADKSREPKLVEFYETGGGDLYGFVASVLYDHVAAGITHLSEVKAKFPKERQECKIATFTIAYGGDGKTIAEKMNTSREKGWEVYEAYMAKFPGLPPFFSKMETAALRQGYVITNDVTRRKCYYSGWKKFKEAEKIVHQPGWLSRCNMEKRKKSKTFRDVYEPVLTVYEYHKGAISRIGRNWPIQGTGADQLKLASINMFNWLRTEEAMDLGCGLLNTRFTLAVHDELVWEVPERAAETFAAALQSIMEAAGNAFLGRLRIKAVPVITYEWTKD